MYIAIRSIQIKAAAAVAATQAVAVARNNGQQQ